MSSSLGACRVPPPAALGRAVIGRSPRHGWRQQLSGRFSGPGRPAFFRARPACPLPARPARVLPDQASPRSSGSGQPAFFRIRPARPLPGPASPRSSGPRRPVLFGPGRPRRSGRRVGGVSPGRLRQRHSRAAAGSGRHNVGYRNIPGHWIVPELPVCGIPPGGLPDTPDGFIGELPNAPFRHRIPCSEPFQRLSQILSCAIKKPPSTLLSAVRAGPAAATRRVFRRPE